MTMNLILVRHGLTDWNTSQRFQGQIDVPLNQSGHQQAIDLGKRLASEQIHAIYTSDLQRAHETAKAIAAFHNSHALSEPRLREISFGKWEGLTYGEIHLRTPRPLASWEANFQKVPPPGGETLDQLAERVQSALDDIRKKHVDETVLVVAHAGPLQVLLCLALGLPAGTYWQFRISPASISEVAFYPAGAMINSLNDTCHLGGVSL